MDVSLAPQFLRWANTPQYSYCVQFFPENGCMEAQTEEPLCTVSKCAYVNYDTELKKNSILRTIWLYKKKSNDFINTSTEHLQIQSA
jgi:hypothetical protein